MLRGRTIAVGVSGGIAAYKACELVRWLRGEGAAVIVVMTPAACEFVTPLTFQALSGNPVVRDLWGNQSPGFDLPPDSSRKVRGHVEHVDVAETADCVVIAPATANLIARLVHGEAPDALTAVALASRAPLVICPAMDMEMWKSDATRDNVRRLRDRGALIVGPDSGPLASGLIGPGRLATLDAITAGIRQALVRRESLRGLKVLVGAGRTEEPLDPVRVFTNRSSGRMGFALAAAARDRGATVTLVAGPASVEPPEGVTLVRVGTAAEMERAMARAAPAADAVLMAAAVADYRPVRAEGEKMKSGASALTLKFEPTRDILAGLSAARRRGQVLVGFALETSRGLERAKGKLRAKGLDMVVLNAPADSLGLDTNRVTLVEARTQQRLPEMSKREVAEHILDRVLALRGRSKRGTAKRDAAPSQRRAETLARGPGRGVASAGTESRGATARTRARKRKK